MTTPSSAETDSDTLFVVAGEPSGDRHAASVVTELLKREPHLRIAGFGGAHLRNAGMEILLDLPSRAIMGIFPVLAALPSIRRWFHLAVSELKRRRPRALLLVDYPGFNLRLAAAAKKLGIPVIYYISPQVWAWRRRRIHKIATLVDLMLVILPFEVKAYDGLPLDVRYVGHPLMDRLAEDVVDMGRVEELSSNGTTVALFPGSRSHVVKSLLPALSRAARLLHENAEIGPVRFLVSEAREGLIPSEVSGRLFEGLDYAVVTGEAPAVMEAADVACTTSGTTTLELTGRGVPFILAYRVSAIMWILGRLLIRVPFIGLVNLVAGREVVPEHIGVASGHNALAADIAELIRDKKKRDSMLKDLSDVRDLLDQEGSYRRTAEEIHSFLEKKRLS